MCTLVSPPISMHPCWAGGCFAWEKLSDAGEESGVSIQCHSDTALFETTGSFVHATRLGWVQEKMSSDAAREAPLSMCRAQYHLQPPSSRPPTSCSGPHPLPVHPCPCLRLAYHGPSGLCFTPAAALIMHATHPTINWHPHNTYTLLNFPEPPQTHTPYPILSSETKHPQVFTVPDPVPSAHAPDPFTHINIPGGVRESKVFRRPELGLQPFCLQTRVYRRRSSPPPLVSPVSISPAGLALLWNSLAHPTTHPREGADTATGCDCIAAMARYIDASTTTVPCAQRQGR